MIPIHLFFIQPIKQSTMAMDWGEHLNAGGIVGYPSDVTVDQNYGYWTTPDINYNFGMSSGVSNIEAKKNNDERKEMLQDLMTESIGSSNNERMIEGVYRQSVGIPAQSTNRMGTVNQLGSGKGRGRGRGKKCGLSLRF